LRAHENWIKVIKANKFWLISGGWDESLHIWDVKSLILVKKIEIRLGPIFDFHLNDSRIVVLSKGKGNDNQLTILDFSMDFSYLKSPIYQN
jgi:WD40 repeat protein